MNARLRDYSLLWQAAVTHANPRLSAIIRWGAPLLALIVAAAAWATRGAAAALVLAWCVGCAVVLLSWAWRFVPGAVKLNSPANAKLVPGMRRRLVELGCIVWFLPVAGIALAPYADPGRVGIWLFMLVSFTLGAALGAAGHQAGWPVIAASFFGSAFLGDLPPVVQSLLSSLPGLVLALLLYAAIIVVVARDIFPEGGERHWRMIGRRTRLVGETGKRDPLLDQMGGRQANKWYAASLRRDSARRDARKLVLHALGPAHHLGELVLGLALLACVVACISVFATWRTGTDVLGGIGWLLACTLLIVPFSTIVRLDGQVAAHPGEQALLRLAPAMPGSAPAFNRHLGRALLLHALASWAIASGAALALTALGGASATTLFNLACACCLLLPLVAAPLRNHARRAPLAAFLAVVVVLVSANMDLLLGFSARNAGLPALPVAAVLSMVSAAVLVQRGMRIMAAAPFAFPAGRMD